MQALVNIDVDDLERAVEFYCAAFDLHVGRRLGGDIDAAVARALAAGALLERPIRTSAWGKLAAMADPFGHGFCFVQFLGRGYDEIASPP